jgi:hypothetical protein
MSSVLLYAGLSAKVQPEKRGRKRQAVRQTHPQLQMARQKEPLLSIPVSLGDINGHQVRAMYKKRRPMTNSPPLPWVAPGEKLKNAVPDYVTTSSPSPFLLAPPQVRQTVAILPFH